MVPSISTEDLVAPEAVASQGADFVAAHLMCQRTRQSFVTLTAQCAPQMNAIKFCTTVIGCWRMCCGNSAHAWPEYHLQIEGDCCIGARRQPGLKKRCSQVGIHLVYPSLVCPIIFHSRSAAIVHFFILCYSEVTSVAVPKKLPRL
jgi:hypothetical protein